MDYNDRLEELAKDILAVAIKDRKERLKLFNELPPDVFRNEEYLIYKIMSDRKENDIVPDAEYIKIFLENHIQIILDDNNIDKSLYSETDGEIVDEVIASTIEVLEELNEKEVTVEDIENIGNNKETFKEIYQLKATDKILENMQIILKDGMKVGKTTLFGFQDANEYYQKEVEKLKAVIENNDKVFYDLTEISLNKDNTKPIKIGTFGALEKLNTQFNGGIYTKAMYNVMAPPKSGKSKFCFRLSHNIAVLNGHNVLIWPYEGGIEKAEAELRAIHFVHYWENVNEEKIRSNGYVSPVEIMYDRYKSEYIKDMELESYNDLKDNPDYGNITIIDESLRIDNYLTILKIGIEEYNPKFIFVDYLQLVGAAPTGPLARINKNERVGQVYQQTLGLIKQKNVAFISPSQMTQESIKELAKGKEIDSRTMGGESSEIIRTPDYNVALYGSPEDITENKLQLLSVPSREAEPMPPVDIGINLGYDYFYDIDFD